MSERVKKQIYQFLSAAEVKDIDRWIAKYPADQKQSAVMSALLIVQDKQGYLSTDAMDAVAEYLDMPAIAVYEVVSFYTMYQTKPIGRHLISVCTNVSCKLNDSAGVVSHIEKRLKVKLGETTADGKFTLTAVECLGACVNAPMMQIDKAYHEKLSPEKIDTILEQYE